MSNSRAELHDDLVSVTIDEPCEEDMEHEAAYRQYMKAHQKNVKTTFRKSLNPFVEDTNPFAEDDEGNHFTDASSPRGLNPFGNHSDEEDGEDDEENEVYTIAGTVVSELTDDHCSTADYTSVLEGEETETVRYLNATEVKGPPLTFKEKENSECTDALECPENIKSYNDDIGMWNQKEYNAIYEENEKSHIIARVKAKKAVIDAFELRDMIALDRLWRPPLDVRVSSWLPNITDQETGEMHTGYFVSVKFFTFSPPASSRSWQVVARFGRFYGKPTHRIFSIFKF